MMLPTDFEEHNCGEKVDYLIQTIVPLIKERNDILQRAEVLLISINALYEKKLQDMESGQELEEV
tara:strand:+ start:589 stop:783 length:195 start_codon:yes stop_codon:yes gene_type:complete